jgi:hypothetical protein
MPVNVANGTRSGRTTRAAGFEANSETDADSCAAADTDADSHSGIASQPDADTSAASRNNHTDTSSTANENFRGVATTGVGGDHGGDQGGIAGQR